MQIKCLMRPSERVSPHASNQEDKTPAIAPFTHDPLPLSVYLVRLANLAFFESSLFSLALNNRVYGFKVN